MKSRNPNLRKHKLVKKKYKTVQKIEYIEIIGIGTKNPPTPKKKKEELFVPWISSHGMLDLFFSTKPKTHFLFLSFFFQCFRV